MLNIFKRLKIKKPSDIYAKKDEIITCTNHHPIAIFIRDVYYNASHSFDDSGRSLDIDFCFKTKQPSQGQLEIDCDQCHFPYHENAQYHFKDGWRGYDQLELESKYPSKPKDESN